MDEDLRRIARGEGRGANFLVAIYIGSETRIQGWVRQMFSTDTAQGLRRLRNRISIEISGLVRRTPRGVRDTVEEAYELADRDVAERLRGQRRRRLSAIDTRASELLIDNLTHTLGNATTTVGRRIDDIYRREALRVSLRGVEVNQPEAVTAGQLEDRLEREGLTGFVDRAGRRWRLGTYARMAVRTTASEALAHGTAQKMAENGFELVEVSSHGCSHHPSDPAHPCVALEGETLRLGEFELPPFHPNCTHFITPSVRNFEPVPELVA